MPFPQADLTGPAGGVFPGVFLMPAMTTVSRSFKAETIADDLARGLALPSLSKALGLLSCSPETDCRQMISLLQDALPFPVVGGTTWALPFESPDDDLSASLTVIDRENLNFAISVSPVLNQKVGLRQMAQLYRDCETELGERPKLLLAMMPMTSKLMADQYMPFLFEAAEGIPVFGGMVSDDYHSGRATVLVEGGAFSDRMVLVGLGGDIAPVFAARCELNVLSEYMPTVTEAEGYVVRRVDDMSFCDYVARQGFDPTREDLTADWPLSLEVRGRHVPIAGLTDVCDLVALNPAEGSGTLAGIVPVGSGIRMGVLSKSDIMKTTEGCLADILAQIKNERAAGHRYSVLFCLPCVARYFAMVGDDNQEGERIRSACPDDLGLFGYYGFNEISPVRLPGGGQENRIMNYSIIMCAF